MHISQLTRLSLDIRLVLQELVQVAVGLDRHISIDVVRELLAFELAEVLPEILTSLIIF